MALTQVSTAGVKDDAVTAGKIPANAVGASELADNAVDTAAIAADAVTGAKIADDAVGAEHIEQLDADLSFADSAKAQFGTGNDLRLYHDGSNSYINNFTGNLELRPKSGEAGLIMVPDGTTKIYYDGSKKLETNSTGVHVTGMVTCTTEFRCDDDEKFVAGTGQDLQLYHNGTHSLIKNNTGRLYVLSDDVWFKDKDDGDLHAKFVHDGAVELYHDNTKQLETDALGVNILGRLDVSGTGANDHLNIDTNTARLRIGGYADLQLFHDSSNINYIQSHNNVDLYIRSTYDDSSQKVQAKFIHDGAVELYHNNVKKLNTFDSGVVISGDIQVYDSSELQMGDASDLKIYHDGSASRIHSGSHPLYIRSGGQWGVFKGDGSESMIVAEPDGEVKLYYNNVKKLETTSSGVKIDSSSDAILELHTSNNTAHGRINFSNETGDNYGGVWYSSTNNLELRSNNAERMRITSAGHVLIHTDSDSSTSGSGFKVLDWGANGTWVSHVYNSGAPANTPGPYLYNLSGSYSGVRFYPRVDGGLSNYQSNNTNLCDERAKTDIVDLGDQWSTVKQWKVRKFRYKKDPSNTPLKVGVIAQQIETVSPDLVEEDWPYEGEPNNPTTLYKTVKEEQMFMIAMKALQEAITKIETLETKVAALEAA